MLSKKKHSSKIRKPQTMLRFFLKERMRRKNGHSNRLEFTHPGSHAGDLNEWDDAVFEGL